jgi:hypothetical protein
MPDINVIINIESGCAAPEVKVNKPMKKKKSIGGILEFPERTPVLDLLGIKES